MKNKKIIIIDSDPKVHKNIESLFKTIEPQREIISYYNTIDALSLFTFFHYLNNNDIIFLDLAMSDRILHVLTHNISITATFPKLYLISSYINYDQISQCEKNAAILDFFPKPIMAHDIQPMVA